MKLQYLKCVAVGLTVLASMFIIIGTVVLGAVYYSATLLSGLGYFVGALIISGFIGQTIFLFHKIGSSFLSILDDEDQNDTGT